MWVLSGFKHLYLKVLTPTEIKAELDEVHGTFAPAFETWVNKFKQGRTSTKDDHRLERPVEVTIRNDLIKSSIWFWEIDESKSAK